MLTRMRRVSTRRFVGAPVDEVFDWIADGTNWATITGMLYSRVRPADGAEPNGVGSIRDFASLGSKVSEIITEFDRPRYMGYQALSSIPKIEHDGGSIAFHEVPGGTDVVWTTAFRLTVPVVGDLLTRIYAPLIKLGMIRVIQAAYRALGKR